MAKGLTGLTTSQKRFIDIFGKLTYKQQSWQVWSDFVLMAACAFSNRFDSRNYEKREKMYMDRFGRYDEKEQALFPQLLGAVVMALEEEPEQDFLGDLFMQLELGSHWKGQFFTPYHLCKVMTGVTMGDLVEMVKEKGYASVNDPACGAGATLIAFANIAKSKGVNYQDHVMFVAQDIDQTAALMCYIQLSLLGCPGYVVVADTLSQPVITEDTEIWYTPMYFSETWHWRRMFKSVDGLFTETKLQETSSAKVVDIPEIVNVKTVMKVKKKAEKTEQPMQLSLF